MALITLVLSPDTSGSARECGAGGEEGEVEDEVEDVGDVWVRMEEARVVTHGRNSSTSLSRSCRSGGEVRVS